MSTQPTPPAPRPPTRAEVIARPGHMTLNAVTAPGSERTTSAHVEGVNSTHQDGRRFTRGAAQATQK